MRALPVSSCLVAVPSQVFLHWSGRGAVSLGVESEWDENEDTKDNVKIECERECTGEERKIG